MPEPRADHDVPSHRATQLALTPPAVVNIPPATTSPLGIAERAMTSPFTPEPSGDHAVPFHRAMLLAFTPPAVVKVPPATRSPLGRATRLRTRSPFMPEPSAEKTPPAGSQAAILFA